MEGNGKMGGVEMVVDFPWIESVVCLRSGGGLARIDAGRRKSQEVVVETHVGVGGRMVQDEEGELDTSVLPDASAGFYQCNLRKGGENVAWEEYVEVAGVNSAMVPRGVGRSGYINQVLGGVLIMLD